MRLSAFLSVFNHWALTLSVKGIPGLASAAYQQRNLLRWIFRFSQSQTLWIPRIRKRHNETQINQALIIFMDGEQINIPFICCLPGSIRRMTDNAQLSWKISFWINICFRSLNRIDTDMFKHRQRRWTWEQKKKKYFADSAAVMMMIRPDGWTAPICCFPSTFLRPESTCSHLWPALLSIFIALLLRETQFVDARRRRRAKKPPTKHLYVP